MATYQIPPSTPMSLQGDVVENWKEFEAAWDDYIIATQLDLKMTKEDKTPDPNGLKMVSATLHDHGAWVQTYFDELANGYRREMENSRRNYHRLTELLHPSAKCLIWTVHLQQCHSKARWNDWSIHDAVTSSVWDVWVWCTAGPAHKRQNRHRHHWRSRKRTSSTRTSGTRFEPYNR